MGGRDGVRGCVGDGGFRFNLMIQRVVGSRRETSKLLSRPRVGEDRCLHAKSEELGSVRSNDDVLEETVLGTQ